MSETMDFPQMAGILPECELGEAKVKHYEVTQTDAMLASLRGMPTYPGKVAQLYVGRTLMMSDTHHERSTNYEVVREACGDVMIAGLGLGMILHPLLEKPGVDSITVVEKSVDVATLIEPTVANDRLSIVVADIFEWKPESKFDVIYFDIWPNICEDNIEEINRLHRRFRKHLKPGGWIGSWMHDELKRQRRRSRRYSYGF